MATLKAVWWLIVDKQFQASDAGGEWMCMCVCKELEFLLPFGADHKRFDAGGDDEGETARAL